MRADIQGQLGKDFKDVKRDLKNEKLRFSEYMTWSFGKRWSFWDFDNSEKYLGRRGEVCFDL